MEDNAHVDHVFSYVDTMMQIHSLRDRLVDWLQRAGGRLRIPMFMVWHRRKPLLHMDLLHAVEPKVLSTTVLKYNDCAMKLLLLLLRAASSR